MASISAPIGEGRGVADRWEGSSVFGRPHSSQGEELRQERGERPLGNGIQGRHISGTPHISKVDESSDVILGKGV